MVAYSYGTGEDVLFCLSGGPGVPCDYLRDSHSFLADHGYRIVSYDQLGTGASDRPVDRSLWRIERFAEEVEIVRRALDLPPVHLLGHSWGGWLGTEYVLTYPDAVRTYVIANSTGDIPGHIAELNRLRLALGSETETMMQRHEAQGTLDHPEYQAALTILYRRHVCRLQEWPELMTRPMSQKNHELYQTAWGPNEFVCMGGNLRDWDRLPDMHRIRQPCLILVGQYDELTPRNALAMKLRLPDAELRVFPNSAHMPMFEEPEAYFAALIGFLGRHRVSAVGPGLASRAA